MKTLSLLGLIILQCFGGPLIKLTKLTHALITPRGGIMLTKVQEIIDPHTGQWDEDLIRQVFSPVDANRILRIHLNVEVVEDFVAWHHTRSGTFSVRSAYHVEFENQFGRHFNRNSQGSANDHEVWKELWKLRLPGKVKHFGWKVLKGFFHAMMSLLIDIFL